MIEGFEVLTHPSLAGAAHGFLGRRGGVSAGLMHGLNVGLGSEDNPAAIAENRTRARDAVLSGAVLVTPFQIHSAVALTVTEPWPDDDRPRGDALVTDRPGLLLGVLTADCVPVLLHDAQAGVIGAAHAGWRGAIDGVTDATVAAMVELGASVDRIAAVVGPCIQQPSYEVDDAFEANFVMAETLNARFFRTGREGHAWFDLSGYVVARLQAAGVQNAVRLDEDTYTQADRFFSFRRATHRGEPGYGRQISVIGLRG
ncbi:peptidoglycan editing factor PgeF [Novosphingobium sp.]|uniref:peptidoglycan editing factor PgeF n=1 Tax=Novosphingobium sp. TaxID=1874826 RepID=UPI0025FD6222|nr:peptidoglycan editing factor PgeF [Novosphingobium sp.]